MLCRGVSHRHCMVLSRAAIDRHYGRAIGFFIFSGLTIQHQALLRRGMQFTALAVIQVVSIGLANVLAISRCVVLSIVLGLVVLPVAMAAFRLAGTWLACAWRPKVPRRGSGVRAMVGFGANLTGFNFVNYFARNADNLLIGWWWGATSVRLLTRAYRS